MDENPSEVTGVKHDSSLSDVTGKLVIIVKRNDNYRLKKLLQSWVSNRAKSRNLRMFHPERLASGVLIMDDTPYTRNLCQWLKTMNFRDVVVMEYKPLWEDMFD